MVRISTMTIALAIVLGFVGTTPAQTYYQPGAAPTDPGALVNSWYMRYLRRPADPTAASWVRSLKTGHPPEQVLSTILSSEEYYTHAGNTPASFVHQLFLDQVGREPTAAEVGYWLRRLRYDSRKDIAYELSLRHPQNWHDSATPAYSRDYYPDINSGNFPDPSGPYYKSSYEYRRPIRAFSLSAGR